MLTFSVFWVITVDLKDDYCYSCTPPLFCLFSHKSFFSRDALFLLSLAVSLFVRGILIEHFVSSFKLIDSIKTVESLHTALWHFFSVEWLNIDFLMHFTQVWDDGVCVCVGSHYTRLIFLCESTILIHCVLKFISGCYFNMQTQKHTHEHCVCVCVCVVVCTITVTEDQGHNAN